MPIDMYPVTTSEPESVNTTISIVGVNDANPTETYGKGVTITRTAEGVYRITWATNPGTFVGIVGHMFGATTMSDVKGYTVSRGVYNTSAYTLDLSVWNSSFAAADIVALQYLDVTVQFKRGPAAL